LGPRPTMFASLQCKLIGRWHLVRHYAISCLAKAAQHQHTSHFCTPVRCLHLCGCWRKPMLATSACPLKQCHTQPTIAFEGAMMGDRCDLAARAAVSWLVSLLELDPSRRTTAANAPGGWLAVAVVSCSRQAVELNDHRPVGSCLPAASSLRPFTPGWL
jgi:hypothetical protein